MIAKRKITEEILKNEYLTVQATIKRFGISRATLYRLIDEGLPYKVCGARKKYFNPVEVENFLGERINFRQTIKNKGERLIFDNSDPNSACEVVFQFKNETQRNIFLQQVIPIYNEIND